jgi:hypothetical protein
LTTAADMVAGFLLSKSDSTVEILVKCGELEMEG